MTTFKEPFHYGTVCGVQRETTTFNFSRLEKQSEDDINEVSEKNIKVLDILFHEKLQIKYMFQCNPL